MSVICSHCKAVTWKGESSGICCNNGKVKLEPLRHPPEPLKGLLMGTDSRSKMFLSCIRTYNNAFQITSFGAKSIVCEGTFMPTFKIQGQVYHLIGSLLPEGNEHPQFLQLYFMGNDSDNIEATLRCNIYPGLNLGIVQDLQKMLHVENNYINSFKTALDQHVHRENNDFRVIIRAENIPIQHHKGRYNAPVNNEVAVLIVGQDFTKRDIILHLKSDQLQRISELHRSYDPLQYPLMFPYGEDGYHINVLQCNSTKTVSAMTFYRYRIMVRENETNYLHYFRQIYNQYLVDMYAKIESERLSFIRNNQKKLRVDDYIHLKDAIHSDGNIEYVDQLVILPSSFTGCPRYMHEKTQDAMTYVRKFGRPDLFITFTTNPKWPEITDTLLQGQQAHDRHDIISRIFHLKVKRLINLLTKRKIFGTCTCYMYSIEWQKRGLPHVHILLWLEQKITPNQIDLIISAEFPDKHQDPLLFSIIKSNMVHGPCGSLNPKSPCMKNDKCTKRYPRSFVSHTITGQDGYPTYKRRSPEEGGSVVEIKIGGIEITDDNHWVVPYCPLLCKTFNVHINVEFCNSVKSIKYICKYVNKGTDQATFAIVNKENDELYQYQSGRYISSSEAVWRILSFPIHERYPPVTHLAVHLEKGQRVYFTTTNVLQHPFSIWVKHRNSLTEDIYRREQRLFPDLNITYNDIMYNEVLIMLQHKLQSVSGKTLQDYGLPAPHLHTSTSFRTKYTTQTTYDIHRLLFYVQENENLLVSDQKRAYDEILESVHKSHGKIFFLDSPGGTGKTFLINLILAKIRSDGKVAIAVASSGIAATLLEGGKTAHSAFKLPLNLTYNEAPVCNVKKGTLLAQVLQDCVIIIWDECTMSHKAAIEALNRTLQDIRNNENVMGGVTVLFSGDFRQTLPVIPRGTRADEVRALLKSSFLWSCIHTLTLTINMRVLLHCDTSADAFSKLLLAIGNGEIKETSNGNIDIPNDLANLVNTVEELTERLYPNVINLQEKSDAWLCERALLSPTNNSADEINNYVLQKLPGDKKSYFSIDSVLDGKETVHYPIEFLNSLNPPGMAPNKLFLKVGVPVILLRNLNSLKLCNGTRLRVIALQSNIIEASILTGCAKGEKVFIPRIPMISSNDYPFQFKRLQFPIKLCFALTINKAQGQTFSLAGYILHCSIIADALLPELSGTFAYRYVNAWRVV
ncbi:uncharacterized protein LOC120524463 [Polypterus senegalus]|uniref:uncharacterized protein LOC120524463 n=1 Tax=Polypterus senegalus TaxID=55291 RepID=UPI0019629509|nr:uncharacterized protein LOC120524463 [Polypterus senegalus]